MGRFLDVTSIKKAFQNITPTVLYTNNLTSFPNTNITTATLPITLNQDCTKFKKLLVEGIIGVKQFKPDVNSQLNLNDLYDVFVTTEIINPAYGDTFALQDWFLYDYTEATCWAYCFRLVCQISNDGTKFNVLLTDGENKRSGIRTMGNSNPTAGVYTGVTLGYPIAITKVIGFNNLK